MSGVWLWPLVTRPGRDCLCNAPPTPQRPDQYHHRPARRGVTEAGAGQPPSEAINLQSTETESPSLQPDCGANVQPIVSHTWISINLQIISSHDTWSPHRMWEKAGWVREARGRRTMHWLLPEQNSIPMTTSASAGRGRHSSESVTALSKSTKIIICTVIILQHNLYLCW